MSSRSAATLVRSAIQEYLEFLDAGGQRINLNLPNHKSDSGLFWASEIGDCSLKAANRKNEIPPDFEIPPPLLLFQAGTRIAEIVQEALVFALNGTHEVSIELELEVPDVYSGRPDAVIHGKGCPQTVVEVKFSNAREFHEAWAWQTLAYILCLYAARGVIVHVDRYGNLNLNLNLYTMVEQDGMWVVTDEQGGVVASLAVDQFWAYLADMELYDSQVKAPGSNPTPPFEGPFDTWECFAWVKDGNGRSIKPYQYSPTGNGSKDGQYEAGAVRPGYAEARCPWAGRCWGVTESQFEVTLGETGKEMIAQ